MPDLTRKIPSSLEPHVRRVRFGARGEVPVMLVHPEPGFDRPVPFMVWMHGRTVDKETDPGRYVRWKRAGIGACAIDLPGHGERYDESLQSPGRAWDVLRQMLDEIDQVIDELRGEDGVDPDRTGIGGMSLGGMVTLARLIRPHAFACASVEATTGSWTHQSEREMFQDQPAEQTRPLEPITNLENWREVPLQAIHSRADEWVFFEGQKAFIDALRERYEHPDLIEFIVYQSTGAPYEHAGFGRFAADAKRRQVDFLTRFLTNGA